LGPKEVGVYVAREQMPVEIPKAYFADYAADFHVGTPGYVRGNALLVVAKIPFAPAGSDRDVYEQPGRVWPEVDKCLDALCPEPFTALTCRDTQ
jgi:hypothetical protein